MKAVIKRVGKPAMVGEIGEDLKSMQEFVGGYIEPLQLKVFGKKVILICDEEGKLKGKKVNFTLPEYDDVIVGDAFFVAQNGSAFRGLNEEEVTAVLNWRLKEDGIVENDICY